MSRSGFEELRVWQRLRTLCAEIHRVTATGSFARDYNLRDQISRAAVSAMSNVAEGFERNSRKEFARFLTIARGSLGEVRSQLYVALDFGYIEQAEFRRLAAECIEIKRMLIALRKSLGA